MRIELSISGGFLGGQRRPKVVENASDELRRRLLDLEIPQAERVETAADLQHYRIEYHDGRQSRVSEFDDLAVDDQLESLIQLIQDS